jgi:ABC-type lipoprotein export system ATPase subunit
MEIKAFLKLLIFNNLEITLLKDINQKGKTIIIVTHYERVAS